MTCIITGCCLPCTVSTLGYNQCAHWASASIPVCTLDIFMSSVHTRLSSVLTGHKHIHCAHWICVLAGCNIYVQYRYWLHGLNPQGARAQLLFITRSWLWGILIRVNCELFKLCSCSDFLRLSDQDYRSGLSRLFQASSDLSENHYGKNIYSNNPNCVPMALRNGSITPGSKPLIFGPNVFIDAGRFDHARSAVVCAQSMLCHLENERFSAVARRKHSRSSTAQSAVL
jgi:hypothetical protein